jgi:lauroyl/myristoyl acyltransferase
VLRDPLSAALAAIDAPHADELRRERRAPRHVLYDAARWLPVAWACALGSRVAVRRLTADRDVLAEMVAVFDRFLEATPHEGEGAAVARRAVALSGGAAALVARPEAVRGAVIVGGDHLGEAFERGRGVLHVTVHSGTMWLAFHTACMGPESHYLVAAPWLDTEPLSVAAWRRRRWLERDGARAVIAGRGQTYAVLEELLRRGSGVSMSFDVRGNTPVRFMNKPALVRSGIARLAFDTGAVISPAYADIGHGNTVVVRRLPLLAPEDFPEPRSLLQALATTFESVLLERPELWLGYKELWPRAGDADPPAAPPANAFL